MKYILMLLLLLSQVNAGDTKEERDLTIGLGPYVQTQPYKGVDALLLPSPVIFYDDGIFYVRWSQVGLYFLGNKGEDFSWGLSLTAQPRVYGYKAEDSKYLKGMDDRDNTFEGGLSFAAKYHDAYIETMLLTDMFARYESWIFKTEIGDKYTLGNLSFYPSLIFIYESADFVNYYYGVKKSEATATRSEFIPGEGWQVGAQTYIKYPFTNELSGLVNLRVDKIPSSATNSPLLETDIIYSGLVSLIYTFTY